MTLTAVSKGRPAVWAVLAAAAAAVIIPAAATATAHSQGRPHDSGQSVRPCGRDALESWLGVTGEASLGTYRYPLEITNAGRVACRTAGFSVVAAYSAAASAGTGGHQIGAAARLAGRGAAVTIAPGATAHQELAMADVGAFTSRECHQVRAPALRLYPRGPLSAVIRFSFEACSAPSFRYLFLSPVQPGLGIPGASH